MALFLTTVLASSNLWDLESDQVLGLSSEKKVGLWEFKDQINTLEGLMGYVITAVTGFGAFLIKTRLGI